MKVYNFSAGPACLPEEVLKKARNQLSTRLLRRLQTVSGLANQIGMSTYLLGDPLGFINGMARIDKVRSADIKRVASRYLVSKNLSLVLLPASTTRAPSKSKGGQR